MIAETGFCEKLSESGCAPLPSQTAKSPPPQGCGVATEEEFECFWIKVNRIYDKHMKYREVRPAKVVSEHRSGT